MHGSPFSFILSRFSPSLVFNIWKAFGGNTRDLGSFGEETDKTTNLHQHLLRISTQKLETASQITRDAVTTHLKTVSECTTQPFPIYTHLKTASLRNEDPLHHIWLNLSIVDNIQADEATRDTSRLRFFHFSLKGKVAEWLDRIPLTQIMTWDELNNPSEQVCLSGGDIYNDPSLLRFYQNNDTSPRGNNKRKEKGEDGPEWIIRSKFKDELANFMLEKKSHAKGIGAEPSIIQEPAPQTSILYQPSKSSNLSFLSRLKKQKKDDEDERLLSIFKQIHINLPFLEAMIHMPKGSKVLKDLLSHKEKLEKAAPSVKLSEECSAIIQRSLPQKEGDIGSFTLPCLIKPLAVKNALANLGASINIMPHSLFRRLGVSKLKPTKMSIQLADRSIKYPIDFIVLEMDEDELVLIILRRPFLATARAVIDVHEGKLSFRVGIDHDGEWTEEEEEGDDPNKVFAFSFYPKTEPVDPLEWKALDNRLKPSSVEPPKLELKELPEHLEYAFLQENNQLPVVVPKKGGMTVVKNEKDELISQRTVTRWRVCIDYRNLNNATRKDHFLLPFISQWTVIRCSNDWLGMNTTTS
ncbi:DNA-directed DNA polymerase [Tanacetum coccineum]|uniref:DNA-directed DNA polymerase n=1 Tax=Tanacetum coccineum TaxID=301880 RepID=A0ABQ4WJQ6_9ASTR